MSARKIVAGFIAFALAVCLGAAARAQDEPSKPHARAELLADVAAVAPGAAFHLGVRIKMDSGWHIYWANPGESGLPTRLDIAGQLVKIGAWHFPPPIIFGLGTPITGYGYEHETTIWTDATASPDAPVGRDLTIAGKAAWLACRTTCIPGSQELSLTLPIAAASAPGPNAAAVNAARAAAPLPLEAIAGLTIAVQYDAAAIAPGKEFQALYVVKAPPDAQLAPPAARDRPLFAEHKADHVDDVKIASTQADPTPRRELLVKVAATATPQLGAGDAFGGVFQFDLLRGGQRRLVAVEHDWPLPVAAPGAPVKPTPLPDLPAAGPIRAGTPAGGAAGATRLLWMLLFAFVGGAILNVMPCVLPVVSLKIFSLMGQAHSEKPALRRHGRAYAAGILVSFLALATTVAILKRGGEAVGWGFQFQSPLFVGLLAAIVFVFGLSLLDVFLLLAPTGAAVQDAAAAEGWRGSFFNGVFATVLATPCTAPFLGAAVGFAFTQPIAVTFAIFLAAGSGLAAPFLLLAYFPGWTRHMPKPGAWMETFKSVMGFLLMGTVVWLLDVLGREVGAPGLLRALAYLALLGFAAWLYGRFGNVTRTRRVRRAAGLAAAVIAVTGGAYLLRFAPAQAAPAAGDAAVESGGIAWAPFSPGTVNQLTAEGKTVFLDFTAAWCWTCKVNEKAVIETDAVRQAFTRLGVVAVRGDWTVRNEQIGDFLRAHGKAGVPAYAVIGPGVGPQPYFLPEVITKEMVIQAVEKAAGPL